MLVMFVDDESIIREGLRTIIPWHEAGFENMVEASNALTALEQIKQRQPDLIVTDIFMPEMSGIEFAKKVRTMYPSIRILILTGYEKFEYAQEAVQIGVVQYLVKPIFPDELMEAVLGVSREIKREQSEQSWKEEASKRLSQYAPIIKEKFWSDLLNGNLSAGQEMEQMAFALDIDMGRQPVSCIAIKLDVKQVSDKYGQKHVPLIKYAVRNIAEEVLLGSWEYFVDVNFSTMYGIFHCEVSDEQLERLHTTIEQTLGVYVFVGMGGLYADMTYILASASEAEEAASLLVMLNEKGYVRYHEAQSRKNYQLHYPYAEEKAILHELSFKNKIEAALIYPFIEMLKKQKVSVSAARLMYIQLLCSVHRLADQYELSNEISPHYANYMRIMELETEEEAGRFFHALFTQFVNSRSAVQADDIKRLAEAVKNAVREGFREPDISVSSIAKQLGITPNYLSRIFHQKAGQTTVEYLTMTRMEEAKMLLTHTALKSFEVAERVGYLNAHYFSTVFKKHTGFTPGEYRERQGSGS